jgi:hypothetical protein
LKDCNTVALITLSLFISAAFCSAGDSYSQLYNPHGVKILSPTKEQEVPINIQNFTVEGVSTDNSTNSCDVSLLLNGITPYVKVSSKGQNGPNDFSAWERIFNSNLHLNEGENKLTAKLLCSDDKNNQITKYHSVNFTGTKETGSTPITKSLNSPSTTDDISPTNIPEIVESESTSLDFDDQTKVMSRDQVVRNITSGPVIIPPSESQESSMFDSSPVNDSVILPDVTNSGSSSDNGTSLSVLIPPSENGSSANPLAPVNNQFYSRPNQVSREIIEQPESRGEETDEIPLIIPTPSPRVTSDDNGDDSVLDSPVQDLSPAPSDVTSLRSKANTTSSILNQTVSEPYTGGMPTNVRIPNSSKSNFSGSPNASNALATPSKNQSQTTVVSNSSLMGDANGTSIRTTAGVDQIVNEGMEVILNGDSTSTNSSQFSYKWRQIGGDVKVSLGQQNAKQISFQAPEVDKDSKLTFRFIASIDGTQISSDEVNITINDIAQNLEKNESNDSQDGDDDDDDN